MNYFVVDPSGHRYGPADLALLNHWVAEGRILPDTIVENASIGMRTTAIAVPGISFAPNAMPGAQSPHSAPIYGAYPRQFGDGGQEELKQAWMCAIGGFCCCGIISLIGILRALEAKRKGNPGASAAIVVNVVVTLIWVLIAVVGVRV